MHGSYNRTHTRRSEVAPHHAMKGLLIGTVAGAAAWAGIAVIVGLMI